MLEKEGQESWYDLLYTLLTELLISHKIIMQPRTLEIEHFLGVKDQVVNAGAPWPVMHFYDPSDSRKVLRSMAMLEKVDPTPAFPIVIETIYQSSLPAYAFIKQTQGVVLGQYKHQAILRSEIEKLGGRVEYGTSLVGFTQDDNGVTAQIVKTVGGKEEKEIPQFKYLIGADGGHSRSLFRCLIRKMV